MKRILSLLAIGVLLSVQSANALTCYLLTQDNKLATFDSASPGTAAMPVAITGVTAGYELVGLDIRTTLQPGGQNAGVGSLWAFATDATNTNYKLYVINPTTAVATQVGVTLTGINGSGSGNNAWFFGFDPATDRIRIMNFIYNYEINPNTGSLVQQTNIQGFFPNSNGSAFVTAPYGGSTQMYFVDQNPNDSLRTSTTPSTGVSSVVGDLGISFSVGSGLDIMQSATFFATDVGGTASFYSINRTTGAATFVGAINNNPSIRALAIKPTSFPGKASLTVKINGAKKITTSSASRIIKGTVKSNAGVKLVEYRVGTSGKFKKAKGTTKWKFTAKLKPGTNVISVRAKVGKTTSKLAKVTVVRS